MSSDPSEDLRTRGFCVLPGLLPAEEVLATRDHCEAEWDEFRRTGNRWFGGGSILGHINYVPAPELALFARWISHPAILACIGKALGEEAALLSWGGNLNIPGSAYQPPHTDGLMDLRHLIVNVPLGVVDETNGSTELYPGSHVRRMSYKEFRRDFGKSAIRVNSGIGDVVLRFPNLWHRGTPNRSARPRMMLGAIFGPRDPDASPIALDKKNAEALRASGLAGRIAVQAGADGAFAQNYFAPTAKGIAKEVVCRHAPWLYGLLRG
jgi:hypothetical protein